jgi:hypothetical protein
MGQGHLGREAVSRLLPWEFVLVPGQELDGQPGREASRAKADQTTETTSETGRPGIVRRNPAERKIGRLRARYLCLLN